MRVVDTSAWIEWLTDAPAAAVLEDELPSQDRWLVPTIVQFELAKWVARTVGEERGDAVLSFSQLCVRVPLDSDLAFRAAEISVRHGLATADAIVYATALEHGAELLTCDSDFESLPGVVYVDKRRS